MIFDIIYLILFLNLINAQNNDQFLPQNLFLSQNFPSNLNNQRFPQNQSQNNIKYTQTRQFPSQQQQFRQTQKFVQQPYSIPQQIKQQEMQNTPRIR